MKINFIIPKLTSNLEIELRNFQNKISTKLDNKINEYINKCLSAIKLIDNLNELSDEEFIQILTNISKVSLNKFDILQILSNTYNKNYTKYKTIYTTMVSNSTGFYEKVQIVYKVACTKNFSQTNKTYTKEELKKLIDEKTIIIVKEYQIDYDEYIEEPEEYEQFDIIDINFLDKNNQFYKNTIKYLRSKIATEEIKLRLIKYLERLKIEIQELDYLSKSNIHLCENQELINNRENYINILKSIKNYLKKQSITKKLSR